MSQAPNNNYLLTLIIFSPRISLRLKKGDSKYLGMFCGVVRDGADCNKDHTRQESTLGWWMDCVTGSLSGNGKQSCSPAGEIGDNDVLSMEVDLVT